MNDPAKRVFGPREDRLTDGLGSPSGTSVYSDTPAWRHQMERAGDANYGEFAADYLAWENGRMDDEAFWVKARDMATQRIVDRIVETIYSLRRQGLPSERRNALMKLSEGYGGWEAFEIAVAKEIAGAVAPSAM